LTTERQDGAPALADVLLIAASVWRRFSEGQSLDRALASEGTSEGLRAAAQALSYAAVRHRALGERLIARLSKRPPSPEVAALLAVALPQLVEGRHADYTVVDQSVVAARRSPATAAAGGFVNAILRSFLRSRDALLAEFERLDEVRFNAPQWWIDRVRAACRDAGDAVLETQVERPPLVLRVAEPGDVDGYREQLTTHGMAASRIGPRAIWLHVPRPVSEIPGFARGEVSVQDAGAQLAAPWLGATPGMRVLDACAAPGGKTAHLAETADIDLVALEVDPGRARRIEDNLRRTQSRARLVVGDASTPAKWWDGRAFERILLDAPCTASGIVRRHPDIPWLRRPADVAQLATLQGQLLGALWPLLGAGGRLLYVVCSVFPEEGSEQIERFVQRQADAVTVPLTVGAPSIALRPTPTSEPALAWDPRSPIPTLHDGFYFALLEKSR